MRVISCLGECDGIGTLELARRVKRDGPALTRTLQRLEQDGLVQRTLVRIMPPKVEFRLTDMGRSFVDPAKALINWLDRHETHILAHREHTRAVATLDSEPRSFTVSLLGRLAEDALQRSVGITLRKRTPEQKFADKARKLIDEQVKLGAIDRSSAMNALQWLVDDYRQANLDRIAAANSVTPKISQVFG